MKYPEHMLLKLPAGSLSRIDAVTKNRNAWLRDLIGAVLGGPIGPVMYCDDARSEPSVIGKGWMCPSCQTIWAPSVRCCKCNSPYVSDGVGYVEK